MKRILLYISVPLLIALVASYAYLSGGRVIETDNAYVRMGILTGAARVSGEVREVHVVRNQHVEEGDLLAEIDTTEAMVKLSEAQAGIVSARNIVEAIRANYRKSVAALEKEKELLAFETRELKRAELLARDKNLSEAALDSHRHKVEEAKREIAMLEEAVNVALTQLGGQPDVPTDLHPMVLKSLAALENAEVALERCQIRARTAGTLTQIDLHPGEYIAAGTPIFGMTVDGTLRIEANIKETELAHVRVGQVAEIRVDAVPGKVFTGKISSIDPATGSEFAVLPAQNATGNWVKITQRVPVQITLDKGQDVSALRSGLSVIASIDTGYKRTLKDLQVLLHIV